MDLLSGLRKGDSSRGGRAEFKWEDVKEDKDRENYLGHSLMARVLPSPPPFFPTTCPSPSSLQILPPMLYIYSHPLFPPLFFLAFYI